jgi:hypothetical protein
MSQNNPKVSISEEPTTQDSTPDTAPSSFTEAAEGAPLEFNPNDPGMQAMAAQAQFLRYQHRVGILQQLVAREAQAMGAPPIVAGQIMSSTTINSNMDSMANLLISKGLITQFEYGKAMADGIDGAIQQAEARYDQILAAKIKADPNGPVKAS